MNVRQDGLLPLPQGSHRQPLWEHKGDAEAGFRVDQDEWRVNAGEKSGRVPSPTPAATPTFLFVVPFSFQELRI